MSGLRNSHKRTAKYAILIEAEYQARVFGADDIRKGLRELIDRLHPANQPRWPGPAAAKKVAPVQVAKKLPACPSRDTVKIAERYLVGLTDDGKPIFENRMELTGTDA